MDLIVVSMECFIQVFLVLFGCCFGGVFFRENEGIQVLNFNLWCKGIYHNCIMCAHIASPAFLKTYFHSGVLPFLYIINL